MPIGEEERRRCCALGGCGCGPPGSAEQRAALTKFLAGKLAEHSGNETAMTTGVVDSWMEELFKPIPDEDATAG